MLNKKLKKYCHTLIFEYYRVNMVGWANTFRMEKEKKKMIYDIQLSLQKPNNVNNPLSLSSFHAQETYRSPSRSTGLL